MLFLRGLFLMTFLSSCSTDFDFDVPTETNEYQVHHHGQKIEFDMITPATPPPKEKAK